VRAVGDNGVAVTFLTVARLDSQEDLRYYRKGGILHAVLREKLRTTT
jgi:aconitase A